VTRTRGIFASLLADGALPVCAPPAVEPLGALPADVVAAALVPVISTRWPTCVVRSAELPSRMYVEPAVLDALPAVPVVEPAPEAAPDEAPDDALVSRNIPALAVDPLVPVVAPAGVELCRQPVTLISFAADWLVLDGC
jgi:hypothetical protein